MGASFSASSSSSPRQTPTAATSCSTSPASRAYAEIARVKKKKSVCMLLHQAMILTMLLWQGYILPALGGLAHGEPLRQLPQQAHPQKHTSMAACRRTRTAAPGYGLSSRRRQRTSQRESFQSQMRRDWLLVGSDIRLRAGVLSHWLRGRQPSMTAEVFQSALNRRWV